MDADLASRSRAWIAAAGLEGVRSAFDEIYADMAGRIEARGPACWASGRCCHFEAHGHRLYVTGLETACVLVRAKPDQRITREQVATALRGGGCPFQSGNACGVHGIKPMSCRVYFCDRGAQDWQQALSEDMHARIIALHERFGVPYVYAEWRGLLDALLVAGAMSGGEASAVGPEGEGVERERSCMRTSSANAPPSGLTIRGKPLG
jgi:Fe-S-cluster containining protein